MNYSWVLVLGSYLTGLLCTSRLSPHFITSDEWKKQAQRRRKVRARQKLNRRCFWECLFCVCARALVCCSLSPKVHHRHNLCKPQLCLAVHDVWPAALPCQMAHYAEHSPNNTGFLQMALCWIYTHLCQVGARREKWALTSFHLFKPEKKEKSLL